LQSTTNQIRKIALGTVQFGLPYGISNANGQVSESECFKILDTATDSGIDTIDTAAAYGESEKVLGKYILSRKPNFKIVSKLNPNLTDYNQIEECVTTSLQHLGVDNIYGYLVHDFEKLTSDLRIWETIQKIKMQGLVRKVGVSVYFPEQIEWLIAQDLKFDLIQLPFNILDQRFKPYFAKLKEIGTEIHVRSVFLQGLFFMSTIQLDAYFDPIGNYIETLQAYSQKQQISLEEILLHFAIQEESIDKVVIGITKQTELQNNLNAAISSKVDLAKLPVRPEVPTELLNPSNWPK
jgi:aryl-alcohol dehydrogenase-like predicted oxidoreductase